MTVQSKLVDYIALQNQRVQVNGDIVTIGTQQVRRGDWLNCGLRIGQVPVQALIDAVALHTRVNEGRCPAQFAALVFNATGEPRALDWYFPLVNGLDKEEIEPFYDLIRHILVQPTFHIRLFGPDRVDLSDELPGDVPAIIAGQIAEVFFYRQDILERLLSTPRHIWLYSTVQAYQSDGGIAGGCYRPDRGSVQMVLSRVHEGFDGDTPGAAPFLHEFGHMLDYFDAETGMQGSSQGLYPGLSPTDGTIFTPEARRLFVQGKRLELERYKRRFQVRKGEEDQIPVGHPYVFQNDTEFAAGYFEMFFRNPNFFAAQNPTLYNAYVELFRQDPRRAWKRDFMHYINDNRNFYLNTGEQPWETRLTVPEA